MELEDIVGSVVLGPRRRGWVVWGLSSAGGVGVVPWLGGLGGLSMVVG